MRKAIFCLLLAFGAAFAAVTGVPEGLEGLAQLAFFSLLVIFVVLMINHLVEDR